MKYISLIRHAEAQTTLGIGDRDRDLSVYGAQMAPRLGRRLEQQNFMPDLVYTSPANRAAKTARIMCYELGFPVESIQTKEAIYRASLDDLVQLIQNADEEASHLLLVGHNPSLSELAEHLCPQPEVPSHMATCSLVQIALDIEFWALAEPKSGYFQKYDTPENIKT